MPRAIPNDQLPQLVHELHLKCATEDDAQNRDALACLLGLCGLRREEIIDLKSDDFRMELRSLRVRTIKGGNERIVPVDDFTWRCLQRAANRSASLRKNGTVITTRTGRPANGRNLLRTWHRWSKQILGRRYPFKELRRTAAQVVYEGSAHDIIAVQKLLGHKHVTTTQLYLASNTDVRSLLPTQRSDGDEPTLPKRNGRAATPYK